MTVSGSSSARRPHDEDDVVDSQAALRIAVHLDGAAVHDDDAARAGVGCQSWNQVGVDQQVECSCVSRRLALGCAAVVDDLAGILNESIDVGGPDQRGVVALAREEVDARRPVNLARAPAPPAHVAPGKVTALGG